MRNIKRGLSLVAAVSLVVATIASAADTKFRTDGMIQRVSADTILVRSSAQDIEIKRDAKTKVTGNLSKGAKVTVFYTNVSGVPTATEILVGGAKAK